MRDWPHTETEEPRVEVRRPSWAPKAEPLERAPLFHPAPPSDSHTLAPLIEPSVEASLPPEPPPSDDASTEAASTLPDTTPGSRVDGTNAPEAEPAVGTSASAEDVVRHAAALGALEEERTRFVEAVASLATRERALTEEAERDLLGLSVLIASAVIEREVRLEPELLRTFVKAALDSLGLERPARARLSHDAYDQWIDTFGGPKTRIRGVDVEVVADPELTGLGCIVDSEAARSDGTLDARLENVRRALAAVHDQQIARRS